MTAAYDSIVKILSFIETRRYDKLSIHQLAGEAYLSASHLQRVFRLASGQSLMHYARGRKLAHSLGELLYGNDRIIDVAMRYGFQHEQSYIRAFYKEFGCTPGEAREASRILPIRARIAPEDFKSLEQGLLYGPKLVQVSSMRVVGKVYTYYGFDQVKDAPLTHKAGLDFCAEALEKIPGASEQNVYLGFCKQLEGIKNIEYIPCIQAKNMPHIPEGFTGMTVPPSLCVCFHYVGKHRCEEITMLTAREIYNAKLDFLAGQSRYVAKCGVPGGGNIRHFERIDRRLYDGEFCQMDLIVPVVDMLEK